MVVFDPKTKFAITQKKLHMNVDVLKGGVRGI